MRCFATPGTAQAWRIAASPAQLEREVDALRATIAVEEEGQILTYPFDVERAFALYNQLFDPVAATMQPCRASHLRARRRDASASAQSAGHRAKRESTPISPRRAGRATTASTSPACDWLGRDRDVSTAVSARAFRDVRQAAASRAAKPYLGFGENAPPQGPAAERSAMRGLLGETPGCGWPVGQWGKPISGAELQTARRAVGGGGTDIVTGAEFSDSAIKAPRRPLAIIGSSISPPTAWSPRRVPNARRGRR